MNFLVILLFFTSSFAFILPLQEQVAVDEIIKAIPTLSTLWTTPSYNDISCSAFPGLMCSGGTIVRVDFSNVTQLHQKGGQISFAFGLLSNVTIVNLANLGLTGTIPSTLAGLTKLTSLRLDNNQLNGSIPNFLYTPNLNLLNLTKNLLTGPIPQISSTALTTFRIEDNRLNGTIPNWIGNPARTWIDINIGGSAVSSNTFSGCAPRPPSVGCTYFSEPKMNCYCPGGCSNSGSAGNHNCYCTATASDSSIETCSNSASLFIGTDLPPRVDIVQKGNSIFFRCRNSDLTDLCSVDLTNTAAAPALYSVASPTHLTVYGGVVYYVYSGGVGYLTTSNTPADLAISPTPSENAHFAKSNGNLFVVDDTTIHKVISGVTPSSETVTFSAIENSDPVTTSTSVDVYLEPISPFTSTEILCADLEFNINMTSNLLAGPNDDVFFIAETDTTFILMHVTSVSTTPTCSDMNVPGTVVTIATPIIFNDTIYFFIDSSPTHTLVSCPLSGCTAHTRYTPEFGSATITPIFFIADGKLFVTMNEEEIRVVTSTTLTLVTSQNVTAKSMFRDIVVVDSKLFTIYGSSLLTWTKIEGWKSIGPVLADSKISLANFPGGERVVYFNTASKSVEDLQQMFNGCNGPNACRYANKASCDPDLMETVVCGTTNVTCAATETLIGTTCVTRLRCAVNNAGCALGTRCTESGGTFNCNDINQCISGINHCQNRTCNNTIGLYTCLDNCPTGYVANGLYRCQDLDECSSNSTCSTNANCTNSVGNYSCACHASYSGNPYVTNGCYLTDPCNSWPPLCVPDISTCENTGMGGFNCTCIDGFNGTGITDDCHDIDECSSSSLNNCSPYANCTNIIGSYECTCLSGFNGDGRNCSCSPGFTASELSCVDINECNSSSLNNCSPYANCINLNGSYSCTCLSGFNGNGRNCSCSPGFTAIGLSCVDINECNSTTLNNCSMYASCINTNGSYTCNCASGFFGDGRTCICPAGYFISGLTCGDVDECKNRSLHNCSIYASCNNTNGSFTCKCLRGFLGDGSSCVDQNECEEPDACGSNAYCNNTVGNFTCTCNFGYSGNPYEECFYGEPCENLNSTTGTPCDSNALCTPFPNGVFNCTCNTGWTGNGTLPSLCTDINECSNTTICPENSFCNNTLGAYTCPCNTGYTGDGTSCWLADPCSKSPCDGNATCNNTGFGNYSCACKPAYAGSGYTKGSCYLISPCSSVKPCSVNANCTDGPQGTFTCVCNVGYSGTGSTCADVDECSVSTTCGQNATCTNLPGSYTCSCPNGYNGTGAAGTQCLPIDGCSLNPNKCAPDGNCRNTGPNITTCSCSVGYIATASPPYCLCYVTQSLSESPCATSARGVVSVTGSVDSGTSTLDIYGAVQLSGNSELTVTSPLNFYASVSVGSGSSINADSANSVTFEGPVNFSPTSKLTIGNSTNVTITNCATASFSPNSIAYTLPYPPPASGRFTVINAPCVLRPPSSALSILGHGCTDSNYNASIVPDENGLVIDYTSSCGIITPHPQSPSPSGPPSSQTQENAKEPPFWAWIIVAIGAAIIVVIIVIFAVPFTRRKILGPCNRDYETDTEMRPTSASKVAARATGSQSGAGKAIPNPPFNVTAIADYMAVDTSQISVSKGVIYTVQRVDEGQHWFQAKGANGKLGWFPASYARIEN